MDVQAQSLMHALKAFSQRLLLHPWAKLWVGVLCALPGVYLVYGAFTESLGVNPAETLIRQSGDLTIRALCYVLLVTPLKDLLKMPALLRHRRTLGLAVLAYAFLHLLCYAWLDMGLELDDIVQDIFKRPFGSAWCDLIQRRHQSHGPQAVEDAAPSGVRCRHAGGTAFLLDACWQTSV